MVMRLLRFVGGRWKIYAALLLLAAAIWTAFQFAADPAAPFIGPKLAPPSAKFWLGTDHLGRDVYSRLLHATFITAGWSLFAVVVAMCTGAVLGALAGFGTFPLLTGLLLFAGQLSVVLPVRWLPLLIVAWFGNDGPGLAAAMAAAIWGQFFWVVYDEAKALRGRTFIRAAYMLGAGKLGVLRLHVLPHLLPVVLVIGTFSFRMAVGMMSTLSFLGVGLQPPTPTWGLLIAEGQPYFMQAWWTVVFPTAVLAFAVLLADALGRILDKKWLSSPRRAEAGKGEETRHDYGTASA